MYRKRLVFKTRDTYMVRKVVKRVLDEIQAKSSSKTPKREKVNGKYFVSYAKTPWKEIEK